MFAAMEKSVFGPPERRCSTSFSSFFSIFGGTGYAAAMVQSEFLFRGTEKNMIREVPILAPRGKISGSRRRVIVDKLSSFTALLRARFSRNISADADCHRTGTAHGCERSTRSRPQIRFPPRFPVQFIERRHYADELAFVESHRKRIAS